MALVKCNECGKQISSNANACPACGNPIGGGSAVTNSAFERRIEQYKNAGYIIKVRNGDNVKMVNFKKFRKGAYRDLLLVACFLGVVMTLCFIFVNEIVGLLFIILLLVYSLIWFSTCGVVNIALMKTGKIEETGNVLRNK